MGVTITENFTEGADWTILPFATFNGGPQVTVTHDRIERLQKQAKNSSLEWLSAESSIKEYSDDLAPNRGDVLLVINASTYVPNDPIIISNASYMASSSSFLATYSQGIFFGALHSKFDGANWTPPENRDQGGAPITYCYSEQVVEHGMTNLVPDFMVVVIVCNMFKTVCLLLVLCISRNDPLYAQQGTRYNRFSWTQTYIHKGAVSHRREILKGKFLAHRIGLAVHVVAVSGRANVADGFWMLIHGIGCYIFFR